MGLEQLTREFAKAIQKASEALRQITADLEAVRSTEFSHRFKPRRAAHKPKKNAKAKRLSRRKQERRDRRKQWRRFK